MQVIGFMGGSGISSRRLGGFAGVVGSLILLLVEGCDYAAPVSAQDSGTTTIPLDATSSDDSGADVTGPVVTTWHKDIRPIVEARCAKCHTAGGIAPMALASYADTEPWRAAMVTRVNDPEPKTRMPPWPMDPGCRDVRDARLLTAEEKAAFTSWKADGYAEGSEADYVAPTLATGPELGEPQIALVRAEAYAPSTLITDDYRCFLYPQKVETDRWVSAVDIVPDKREVVHHVLLFVVPGSETGKLEALDAASPTVAGYPCLGGSGATGETLLTGWVPGMQPVVYPTGAAFFLPKGSRFVMQMHYNTANVASAPPAPADATSASLWTLAGNAEPAREVRVRAVADGDLDITKGTANVVEGKTLQSPFSETVIGIIPHMHLLGTHIKVTTRALGSASANDICLADIPQWDFHYQQTYQYADDDQVRVRLGDAVTIRCEYDNSKGSEDVHWGEQTTDEMCLAYLVTTTPRYADDSGTLCDGFSDCLEDCPSGDTLCPIDCLSWSAGDLQCVSCGVEPIYSTCAAAECPVLLYTLGQCLNGCSTPDDKLGCAIGECRSQLDALYGCLEEPLREGKCNDEAAACGIGPIPEEK